MAKTDRSDNVENATSADLGLERQLVQAADKLRNNMDAAEYKHVVLGLIFLNYISEAFEAKHAELDAAKAKGGRSNTFLARIGVAAIYAQPDRPDQPLRARARGLNHGGWNIRYAQPEREHTLGVLEMTGWRIGGKGGAAEVLGLQPTTLQARMAKLGVHRPA